MDMISREELRNLLEVQADPCVSLYMPTESRGQETRQNPIRFRNLLNEAEKKADGRKKEVRKALEPAFRLLNDTPFWQHQGDGLAVFVNPETFFTFRLPLKLPERVLVADRFDLKPILPCLAMNNRFKVLALSRKSPRLLDCTRHTWRNITPRDMPAGLDEFLRYDEFERQTQWHTRTPSSGAGDRAGIFFGQGMAREVDKTNLYRYMRKIHAVIEPKLLRLNDPLVLVGLDHITGIYRDVTNYPCVLDQVVNKSPRELSDAELHALAWEVAEPEFTKNQQQALERYGNLLGTGTTGLNIREILPAARFGRVESLFLPIGKVVWGTYDPDSQKVDVHDGEQNGDVDLLGLAAAYALTTGAVVYPVKPEDMPNGQDAAAIYRY
ncbi:MAG: hypothetical protein JRI97_05055 [Deltaproteobacteria bacterium]|nr:hypothetical protein [Deltaproteobacteria bacterium]